MKHGLSITKIIELNTLALKFISVVFKNSGHVRSVGCIKSRYLLSYRCAVSCVRVGSRLLVTLTLWLWHVQSRPVFQYCTGVRINYRDDKNRTELVTCVKTRWWTWLVFLQRAVTANHLISLVVSDIILSWRHSHFFADRRSRGRGGFWNIRRYLTF